MMVSTKISNILPVELLEISDSIHAMGLLNKAIESKLAIYNSLRDFCCLVTIKTNEMKKHNSSEEDVMSFNNKVKSMIPIINTVLSNSKCRLSILEDSCSGYTNAEHLETYMLTIKRK